MELNGEEARAILKDNRYADAVRINQQVWISSGIQAVLAFILEQKYLFSGAEVTPKLKGIGITTD